jgi:hypothetical protein
MAATKLSLYNGALAAIGERRLKTLTENREPRHILDDVWDRDAIKTQLEAGQWNFATRTSRFEYEPSITPDFGYQYAFQKPGDFVRLVGLSGDEYISQTESNYVDESGFWWCDYEPIYVRYVSYDSQYGSDLSLWPTNFARMVEHWLAKMINPRLTHTATKQVDIEQQWEWWRKQAKNTDAMEDAIKVLPKGRWAKSRSSRFDRGDRGSRNQLLG